SVHQSAAILSGVPRSAEKRGSFQPVSWPRTRTPARKTKTARLAKPPAAADNRRGTRVEFSFWPGDGDFGDGPAIRLDITLLRMTTWLAHHRMRRQAGGVSPLVRCVVTDSPSLFDRRQHAAFRDACVHQPAYAGRSPGQMRWVDQ